MTNFPSSTENARLYRLVPPEGVPISFKIAPISSRFGALLIDIIVTWALLAAIMLLLAAMQMPGSLLSALWPLLYLFLRLPYFVITELGWNGATFGKRKVGLRVISENGLPLGVQPLLARALTREAEIFFPISLIFALPSLGGFPMFLALCWIGMTLLFPVMNSKSQRLGDVIAGTIVVEEPQRPYLADLASELRSKQPVDQFNFLPEQLEHYGAFELQTLERVLRGGGAELVAAEERTKLISAIVKKIIVKIDWTDPLAESEYLTFLEEFYLAQRRFLEKKQLFGEKRANKFYRKENGSSSADL